MVMKMILIQKRKAKRFNIIRGKIELQRDIYRLPEENECFKLISNGSFSSVCFVGLVAQQSKIKNLYISTFHVGKKEILFLDSLKKSGRLENVEFVVCSIINESKKTAKYGYSDLLMNVCEKNGWKVSTQKNHSKVHLYDTDIGKFVLETSSNLNENPKIEQFSFEKDEELFDFYAKNIFECE